MRLPNSIYIFLTMLVCLFSCSSEKGTEKEITVSETEVTLSKEQVEQNGIVLGNAELRKISEEVVFTGTVDIPPQYKASVSALMGGFVKKTNVLEGDYVTQGKCLATLSHPDYIQLQQQYLELLSKQSMLQKELERQQILRDENVNSKKEFERIQAEANINSAQVKALEARLNLLGISPEQVAKGTIYSEVSINSPLTGYVTMVNTSLGKFINNGEVLFEVISKDHIHLDLSVFEQDVLKIRPGQKVMYTLGSDKEPRQAKVVLVGKKLDSESRTISVHAHPDSDKDKLLPGMYVKGRILIDEKERMVLPEEAMIREGEKSFIFILKEQKANDLVFEKVYLSTGAVVNGFVPADIPEGYETRKIVKKGAYYVGAQMNRTEEEE